MINEKFYSMQSEEMRDQNPKDKNSELRSSRASKMAIDAIKWLACQNETDEYYEFEDSCDLEALSSWRQSEENHRSIFC